MKAIMQGFYGTTAEWEAKNPALYKGVQGVEVRKDGSLRVKIGDGKTAWTALKALGYEDIAGLEEAVAAAAESETARAKGEEAGLQAALRAEKARAKAADQTLAAAVNAEAARAQAAEGALASGAAALGANKIDKSVAGEAGTLMQSLEVNEAASNSVTAAYRSVNADTGAVTETLVDLPVASEQKAGVMPAESFRRIGENAVRIAALENRAAHYRVVLDSENPGQGELQRAYEEVSGNAGPAPDQTTLDDTAFAKSYTWYETGNEWADRGSSAILQFGNGRLGAIQGENADGKVFAEHDGSGSVVGWSGLKARVGNTEAAVETKQDKITAAGAENLLTAPAGAGGQPGVKAATDFATAAQGVKADTALQSAPMPATLVVGTSRAGHTENEVDFLCYGVGDEQEINSAILSLSNTGGKIIIREGVYNLNRPVCIGGPYHGKITLQGMGPSTVLNAAADMETAVNVQSDCSKIADLKITNDPDASVEKGIVIGGGVGAVSGCIIENTTGDDADCYGIYISGNDNNITGNKCGNSTHADFGSSSRGIHIEGGSRNIVTGNTCSNHTGCQTTANSSIGIGVSGGNNLVTGNILKNTGYFNVGSVDVWDNGPAGIADGNICIAASLLE